MHTLKNQWSSSFIKKGDISLTLLATGDVFKWMHGEHQINLLQGNPIDLMIPDSLKGLSITYQFQGQPLKVFVAELQKKKTTLNPYRLSNEFKIDKTAHGFSVILKS